MKIKFYLYILKLIRWELVSRQEYKLASYTLDIRKILKSKK